MTFEKWGKWMETCKVPARLVGMYADWKTEREKFVKALEWIADIDYTNYGYDFGTALGVAQDKASAILAEERGK